MNAIEAAQAAGWVYWLGDWYCTDWEAILAWEMPWRWTGTARDLCLGHGIDYE